MFLNASILVRYSLFLKLVRRDHKSVKNLISNVVLGGMNDQQCCWFKVFTCVLCIFLEFIKLF